MSGRFAHAGEFRVSLERFKDLTREQFILAHRAFTIDMHSALQLGNPVRTGRSRASWTASAGEPSARTPSEITDWSDAALEAYKVHFAREAAQASAQAQLIQVEFGASTYVVTNVEYVPWINARHPRRAGFVESALENVATKYQLGAGSVSGGLNLGALL